MSYPQRTRTDRKFIYYCVNGISCYHYGSDKQRLRPREVYSTDNNSASPYDGVLSAANSKRKTRARNNISSANILLFASASAVPGTVVPVNEIVVLYRPWEKPIGGVLYRTNLPSPPTVIVKYDPFVRLSYGITFGFRVKIRNGQRDSDVCNVPMTIVSPDTIKESFRRLSQKGDFQKVRLHWTSERDEPLK